MTQRWIFWVLGAAVAFFAVSLYFSYQKRMQFAVRPPVERIEIPPSPAPLAPGTVATVVPGGQGSAGTVSGAASGNMPGTHSAMNTTSANPVTGPTVAPDNHPRNCKPQPEYLDLHNQLGRLVNSDELRHNPAEFLKKVVEFRNEHGLPFALTTEPGAKLDAQGIVYNNCNPSCRGTVNQVFVSRLVKNRYVEVYTKSGSLKLLPLHDSGLDVSTVDELNRRGVPFRSWKVPTVETDWYISGNKLYYAMDIQGMWLEVTTTGTWKVMQRPKTGLTKLEIVEPAVKVPGCVVDENCLQVKAGARFRYFKAPRACAPVLKHSADELVDHSQDGTAGSGPGTTMGISHGGSGAGGGSGGIKNGAVAPVRGGAIGSPDTDTPGNLGTGQDNNSGNQPSSKFVE